MAVFTQPKESAVVVGIYAPLSAEVATLGASIDVETEYPFGDDAKVTLTNIKGTVDVTLKMRVPTWATEATINGKAAKAGTLVTVGVAKKGGAALTATINFNPKIRTEKWFNDATSVHRGALMYVKLSTARLPFSSYEVPHQLTFCLHTFFKRYSLPIMPNYTVYAHHFGDADMSNDYYLSPQSKWNYALDESSLSFNKGSLVKGCAPFNHSNWPNSISATLREVHSWGIVNNAAAEPPASPACITHISACGPPTKLMLVPHGGTELRIGELPLSGL